MKQKHNENKARFELEISTSFDEAERITFAEAVRILLSVAFGVGYIDILSQNLVGGSLQIMAQFFCLVTGVISLYMLSTVKQAKQNKMGSYQEIAYYYLNSRSIIFIFSVQYGLLLLTFASFALYFSSKQIARMLTAVLADAGRDYVLDLCIVAAITLFYLLPLSQYLNFQKFKRLTMVLIGAILLAFLLLLIQLAISWDEIRRSPDRLGKYVDLYNRIKQNYNCTSENKDMCFNGYLSDS